jgi:shikimate dehydrogenase
MSRLLGLPESEAETRICGVIGWPVAQSLSPAIHNAAFMALGLDWRYLAMPVPPGRLDDALERLAGLSSFGGANVTMPHKQAVAERVTSLSDEAGRLLAVNTIVAGAEGLAGHNTDVGGFARFLAEDAALDPRGLRALVYGAGGAARACALALARGGVASLRIAVRDPLRALTLVESVLDLGVDVEAVSWRDAPGVTADLVVNATPVGALGESLPLPPLGRGKTVVDLLYNPPSTPLLASAREAGCPAFGGLGMLLRQAALSFELWTGRHPPLEPMSAAALAALAEPPG